ncbi:MAG: type I-G CRISPR-associated protein Csb2 [Pirellulales bacterium]
MIAIGIRYLCGWAMATHPSDRSRAEWPPNPDRVFMALAAAHYETDEDPDEHDAMEWLERQHPPHVVASESRARSVVTSYVPVNDASMPRWKLGKEPSSEQRKSGLSLLPECRSRQPRTFPVAIPDSDTAFLVWPEGQPTPRQREALAALCRKVTYVGHSASLVQMWVESRETDVRAFASPQSTRRVWQPDQGLFRHRLRVTCAGRLASLRARFEARQRPTAGLWMGYREMQADDAPPVHRTVFQPDLLVLKFLSREDGRRLGLETTLRLTTALRAKLADVCTVPAPEWLSGKRADGSRSESPHLAIVPLAHVGHEHADGHLLGVAIVLPYGVTSEEQRDTLGKLLFNEDGSLGTVTLSLSELLGDWRLQLDDRDGMERPWALCPECWVECRRKDNLQSEPASCWGTVTPIVLDRYPKSLANAVESVAVACERVAGYRPETIELSPVSFFEGVGHARRDFPPLPEKFGKSAGNHTHAVLSFAEPIRGPLLLGAGRYLGYGFCRPLAGEGKETA